MSGVTGINQFSAKLVIVGEDTSGDMTQRDNHRAGERGSVHHTSRLEAFCIGEGITQDQSAFCVGIEDFNGLARH